MPAKQNSPRVITYYFWTISDWAYLGHERFVALAQRYGADIDYRPIDLPAVYARTGGILLSQRSKQRRDYRMAELRRWKRRLKKHKRRMCPEAIGSRWIISVR